MRGRSLLGISSALETPFNSQAACICSGSSANLFLSWHSTGAS